MEKPLRRPIWVAEGFLFQRGSAALSGAASWSDASSNTPRGSTREWGATYVDPSGAGVTVSPRQRHVTRSGAYRHRFRACALNGGVSGVQYESSAARPTTQTAEQMGGSGNVYGNAGAEGDSEVRDHEVVEVHNEPPASRTVCFIAWRSRRFARRLLRRSAALMAISVLLTPRQKYVNPTANSWKLTVRPRSAR